MNLPNSTLGLLPTLLVAVYIHASTVIPKSRPYILHSYKRNDETTSPAKSCLAFHPCHRHQLVYAHRSILRVSLQFFKFIKKHVLPG
jgi:hypothetical protein